MSASRRSSDRVVDTDVLVVGGGIAGLFAAIKARERGVSVTLLDKGFAGKSGQTPFACGYVVCNPEWGDDPDAWLAQISAVGEYVNHRAWTEIALRESYARFEDLVSWGVRFRANEDGTLFRFGSKLGPAKAALLEWKVFGDVLRGQARKRGVRIRDRVMAIDLLKQDGRVVGVLAMPLERAETHVYRAKATVLCTGAAGFKPAGWPMSSLTADGHVMAYRAGAAITGKEFADTHFINASTPAHLEFAKLIEMSTAEANAQLAGVGNRFVNAEGDEIPSHGTHFLYLELEAHAGRAPVYRETPDGTRIELLGGTASGKSVHKAEGIWPAGTDCSTSLPGLYAAGDALGNMQMGAVYGAFGCGAGGSSSSGAIAGVAAADHARSAGDPEIDEQEVARLRKAVLEPTERRGGFSPQWVTQMLQNAVMPYYVLFVKKEDRLRAALTNVEFFRDHLVPKLCGPDPHELRLAIETQNMVTNAEMRLRASLFRQESRGCHYREDYPRRDDPSWLAWVLLKEEDGEMKAFKEPIPQEWWPDLAAPYEERYPARFPGE